MKLYMLMILFAFAFVPMAAHANQTITGTCGNIVITQPGYYDLYNPLTQTTYGNCIEVSGVNTGDYVFINCHNNWVTDATAGWDAVLVNVHDSSTLTYMQNCNFNYTGGDMRG